MIRISRVDHPSSLDAPEMFVLRAERDLWDTVLQDKVGDLDLHESAKLQFSRGINPQYRMYRYLVASEVAVPLHEEDVLGVASLELPMMDNPRLATLSIAVRKGRRGEGIGAALHAAALDVAREHGRSTIQVWTWEPSEIPRGSLELAAETGSGGVDAQSAESRFLTAQRYVLGQAEFMRRLVLPDMGEATASRDRALDGKPLDYEVITLNDVIPPRLHAGIAELCTAMGVDTPTGDLDLDEEAWDEDRVRASIAEVQAGDRGQMLTVIRHIPSQRLVAFTRIFHDRSKPEVGLQWETLVLKEHRGCGLGMLMKVVNHAAVVECWPGVKRIITGNASENSHMRTINDALGFEPYAATGFWELRLRGTDS